VPRFTLLPPGKRAFGLEQLADISDVNELVISETQTFTTLVDIWRSSLSDAGSIPAISTIKKPGGLFYFN